MPRRNHTRPRLAVDPAEADAPGIRASVRVRTAAAHLDMAERDVRQMLADGELEGHGIGKRGVRIYVDSITAWQERGHRGGAPPAAAGAAPHGRSTGPRYREALASLAKHGIR